MDSLWTVSKSWTVSIDYGQLSIVWTLSIWTVSMHGQFIVHAWIVVHGPLWTTVHAWISIKLSMHGQVHVHQTCKMPEILPEQDFSILDFTRKCVNYDNFKIATKRRNLPSFTQFTQFYPVLPSFTQFWPSFTQFYPVLQRFPSLGLPLTTW